MKRLLLFATSLLVLSACQTQSNQSPTSSTSQTSNTTISSSTKNSSSSSQVNSENTNLSDKTLSDETAMSVIGMTIDQIAQGDYSSVMGTWRNATGQELTFNALGIVSASQDMAPFGDFSSGTFIIDLYSKEDGTGTSLLMIPKGEKIADSLFHEGADVGDTSKDRLIDMQYLLDAKGLEEATYYRVKTEVILEEETGLDLPIGEEVVAYAQTLLGDKNWIIIKDNYNRTQSMPYATLQANDGQLISIYRNGIILNQEGQLIYIP